MFGSSHQSFYRSNSRSPERRNFSQRGDDRIQGTVSRRRERQRSRGMGSVRSERWLALDAGRVSPRPAVGASTCSRCHRSARATILSDRDSDTLGASVVVSTYRSFRPQYNATSSARSTYSPKTPDRDRTGSVRPPRCGRRGPSRWRNSTALAGTRSTDLTPSASATNLHDGNRRYVANGQTVGGIRAISRGRSRSPGRGALLRGRTLDASTRCFVPRGVANTAREGELCSARGSLAETARGE